MILGTRTDESNTVIPCQSSQDFLEPITYLRLTSETFLPAPLGEL